jgi:hypothetical protein
VLALCERFHCLPSQLYAEDPELLRMLRIVDLGTPDDPDPEVSHV